MSGIGWFAAVIGAALIVISSYMGLEGPAFYIILAAGAILLVIGIMRILRDRAIAADSDPNRPLADEVLLRSLARLAYSDTNVDKVEVDTIRRIYKDATGEDVDGSEVRSASRGDLYEATSFDKYLSAVGGKLSDDDKKRIVKAMGEVIRADGRHSPFEVDFFNKAVGALKLSAADLADVGLQQDESATSS